MFEIDHKRNVAKQKARSSVIRKLYKAFLFPFAVLVTIALMFSGNHPDFEEDE